MKTCFYTTIVDIFLGCRTTKLSTWGLAFSRCSAKKEILITTKLPDGARRGVQCFRSSNRTSYPVNSLGALYGPKGVDHDSCTS